MPGSMGGNVFVLIMIVIADNAHNRLPRRVDIVEIAPQIAAFRDQAIVNLQVKYY